MSMPVVRSGTLKPMWSASSGENGCSSKRMGFPALGEGRGPIGVVSAVDDDDDDEDDDEEDEPPAKGKK